MQRPFMVQTLVSLYLLLFYMVIVRHYPLASLYFRHYLGVQSILLTVNQAQYVFCHDAVQELVLCGDTSVAATDLRKHVFMLKEVDPATGKTGLVKELQVRFLDL